MIPTNADPWPPPGGLVAALVPERRSREERSEPGDGGLHPERYQRDGNAARRAQPRDELRLLDDEDPPPRRQRDQLLSNVGAAAPLDHLLVGIDLVGAIQDQIEARRLVERGERQTQATAEIGGPLRSRNAADVELAAGDRFECREGGAPGSVADDHSRPHFEGRCLGGGAAERVQVLGH